MPASPIRVGLIGDNIGPSRAPDLHRLAGELCGIELIYDRLVPAQLGMSFEETFTHAQNSGYRGLNITYPYKEQAVGLLDDCDDAVAAMGACNTVIFEDERSHGYNTDRTGFVDGFRSVFGDMKPGRVAMAGAGGVGRAIAFGLADLGAEALLIYDVDDRRATALHEAVEKAGVGMEIYLAETVEGAALGSDGLVNCSPLGMAGYGGTAFPMSLIAGQSWAMDAVYTPVDTEFLGDAGRAGLRLMDGFELFIHQGVNCFALFAGASVDGDRLREALGGAA